MNQLFFSQEAWDEAEAERLSGPATEAEADREYADNVGADRPECAWVLSDRDVWYRNPYYQGPAVRHPEEEDYGDGVLVDPDVAAAGAELAAVMAATNDDMPF